MPHCTELGLEEMDFNSIYDIECSHCGCSVEFFEDERKLNCPECNYPVINESWKNAVCHICSTNPDPNYISNRCSRFRSSKRNLRSNFYKLYR
jgi:hypothetical protein